jgi:hypothetical protein
MMAGFGNVTDFLAGGVDGFTHVITPGANTISIVGGGVTPIQASDGAIIRASLMNGSTVTLDHRTTELFEDELVSFGCESFRIKSITLNDSSTDVTLHKAPSVNPVGQPVFRVGAITYAVGTSDGKTCLQRNGENIAENIENLQFNYFDANGNETADPDAIRMVRVTITGKTETSDPDYKGESGGDRKRTIASNIKIRNL